MSITIRRDRNRHGHFGRAGRLLEASAARLCALVLLTQLGACSAKQSGQKEAADAPARRALLKRLGEDVILRTYEEFVDKAEALNVAVAAYAERQDETTRERARAAFRDAMLVWERAELYQVGPAADVNNFNPGSAGLRSEIYSWDDVRPCSVDRGLVNEAYASEAFADDIYFYARGMSAIERLLFDESNATACEPNDQVVTPAVWQALASDDLAQRRASYAAKSSEVVLARARELVRAFRDDFLPELVQAGAGSKLFDRTQEALNALTNALFYIDFEARDMKLGAPLGHTMDCIDVKCATELPHSKLSKDALTQNLLALRQVFQGDAPEDRGGEMWGFSDLLASVGAEALASSIETAIVDALAAVDAVEPNLEETSRAPASDMAKAFDALQTLSDLLNTEFLQKLALSPPMRAAGDND